MVFTHPFCMGEIIRLIRHSKHLSFLAIVTEQLYCNGKVFFSYNLFDSTRIAGGFLFHAYSFLLEKLIYNAFNGLKPNTNSADLKQLSESPDMLRFQACTIFDIL